MRHSMKWIAVVLIVLVTGLVGTVGAQKGKPAPSNPTWSVQLSGSNISGPLEGFTPSDAVVLEVKVWGVPKNPQVVQPCNNCTEFRIEVKSPWTPATGGPFIQFNDVQLGAEFNPYNREPNCNFPSFDVNGVVTNPMVPAARGEGCIENFLSHKHPQAPYNRVMFVVLAAGDALAMPVGGHLASKGLVKTQVTGTDCYTNPPADLVYFATSPNYALAPWPDSTGEFVTVDRTATNQWTVNVSRSLGLIDVTHNPPDSKFDTCSAGYYFSWYSYTKPLIGTMKWSRQ